MTRPLRTALTAALVITAWLFAAEAGRRWLDGYRLTSLHLVRTSSGLDLSRSAPGTRAISALVDAIPHDAEADLAWFADRSLPPEPFNDPAWVDDRRKRGHDAGANYVWNAAALNVSTTLGYFDSIKSTLDDVFTFHAPGNDPRPRYRLYPGVQSSFGKTNRFGWRSPELDVAKPAGVIRVAMVGDSTTNHYPALVDRWLNRWAERSHLGVRFEVINAARPSADAFDTAAIFDFELGAFDPDYLIIYGFGNAVPVAAALIPIHQPLIQGLPETAPPPVTTRDRLSKAASSVFDPLARWSAAAVFLQNRISGVRGDHLLPEPKKPQTHVIFPADIDEKNPDPDRIARHAGGQIMGLDWYLQALSKIDAMARQRGTRVFIATFRVFAVDGLLLPKGQIYHTLNELYWWPYTYGQIHRLMAFYNRTLRAWATRSGNGIIPIDEEMPWRQELYGDGVHEASTGEEMHAWIVLQHLMPAIRDDLRQHRLPRQSAAAAARYSDQFWKIDRIKTVDAIATGNAINTAIRRPPADDVAGAFLLSTLSSGGPDVTIVPGPVPRITTSTERAYAAFVPVDPSVAVRGRGWIDVRIKVTDGTMSVGVLNKSGSKFLSYYDVVQAADVQQLQLDIPDLSDVGSVMISNNRADKKAASSAELHEIVLRKIRE